MEAEDRERLIRIDERTLAMADWLKTHEKEDREDFKEVRRRIDRISTKQNVILMVGTGIGGLAGWLGQLFSKGGV